MNSQTLTPSHTTLYWHDYEAFGANARRDRPSQFAGVRTDTELNEIDEPLVIYCQPSTDYLPHPEACLITGITPQIALQKGVPEAEFIRQIHLRFSQAGTCGVGYNSIRFDDEMTRQLLYRNFYDPYEREWKSGNSRWDLIDVIRLCHAVRPHGIQWPLREDGTPSFRLEELTAANGLSHDSAHDALSDVRATIALARLLRQQHPRLYDFAFDLRQKNRVSALLDVTGHKPVLHVSALYGAARGCLALVMPLLAVPGEANAVLVYDLSVDPSPWLHMHAGELRAAMFASTAERRQGAVRLPVTNIYTNRCPVLAPLPTLPAERMPFLGIDLAQSRRHWHVLQANQDFIEQLRQALSAPREQLSEPHNDVDFMLYGAGFFSDSDKRLMARLRQMSATELTEAAQLIEQNARDPRLSTLLFRYRARNYPASLTVTEQQQWQAYCRARLMSNDSPGAGLSVSECRAEVSRLRAQYQQEVARLRVLDQVSEWIDEVCHNLAE